MDPRRAMHPQTLDELARQIGRLFPQSKTSFLGMPTTEAVGALMSSPTEILFPIGNDIDGRDTIRTTNDRPFSDHEYNLAFEFLRVFQHDIESAPLLGRHAELWVSLQHTRMARVIARLSPFHTPMFLKWVITLETAISLRYESKQFATHLVLTKKIEWIRNNPSLTYVPFPKPISVTTALFEEKWTRSLAADGQLSLVGLGHDRGVAGVMYADISAETDSNLLEAPHSNLRSFCSALVPGTIGLLASPRGDLRVLMANGASFVKSQGSWAMIDLRLLEDALATMLDVKVSKAVMRLTADLSYEGRGALLCCVEQDAYVDDVVPDHASKDRPSHSLRSMVRKLDITNAGHQKILKNVSSIDGAVVIGTSGKVLDCACMISDPTGERLATLGILQRQRFPGARTTAAWNASIHGLAVKISEDGPISVFKAGKLILQL